MQRLFLLSISPNPTKHMKPISLQHLKRTLSFAAILFSATIAQGQLINVNFTNGNALDPTTLEGPGGGLGTSWNQYAGYDSTGVVVDSTGGATTVTIDTNFSLAANDNATPLTMLRHSITDFGKGAAGKNVTISGLANGETYDIWLVTLRNQPFGSDGTEQYVGWWSTTHTTTSPSDQLVDAVNPTINTSTFVEGYNYVLFENVVATGGQIVFTGVAGDQLDGSDNNHRHGLNGLQIKKSNPLVAGPVDDAMSTVESFPASVLANDSSTATVTVTLKDAAGIRVPGKDVTLANTGGPQSAVIDPPTALTTNTSGEVSFSVSSGTLGIEVFSATVVTDSLTLTDTASVEFTDPGAPVAFNVNFHGGSAATGLIGAVGDPGETWNQGTSSVSNLTDTTGTVVSSVNVTGLPNSSATTNADLNVFDANRNFFDKGSDTTLSITGLVPDTAYDLYIYALGHFAPSWEDLSSTERGFGDFVTSNTVNGNGQTQTVDNAKPGTNASIFVPGGNYVVFQSIVTESAGNISILADAYDGVDGNSATNDGDTRLYINALQIRPASGISVDYGNWREASFPGLGLPDEDDDGDGLSNDEERIFGLDPTDPASVRPITQTVEPATGAFSYSRRNPFLANLDYQVWYSTNLEQWFQDNAAFQTIQPVVGDIETVDVQVDPALLSEPRLFVQVRASEVTGIDPEPSLLNLWGSGNTVTVLYSEPMNASSAGNLNNYSVTQEGGGTLNVTDASVSSDGASVTLTLDASLGLDTGYTVSVDGITSGTGQSLESGTTRQFTTWDDNPNGIKVFIVAGQSNMVGYGSVENGANGVAGAIGSLRFLAANNDKPEYNYYDFTSLLTNPGDTGSAFATRSDVKWWWKDGGANLGGTVRKGDLGPTTGVSTTQIGPEYAFGQVIGDFYASDKVLIIKCAWGGRDLATKFRPPSAVADRGGRVGDFYNAIIDLTREALADLDTEGPGWSGQGYQLVGFGWHQGFNDRIDAAFSAEYKDNLPDLIEDVREVFNKPNLPFVIATTGMDTGAAEAPPYAGYSAVEKAQLWVAGVPQPAKVRSTDTRPFQRGAAFSPSTQGFHWNWNAESYFLIGKSLGDDMVDLLNAP